MIFMKKIGYARVSTREQSINSQALEQQIARLAPYVDEVFTDIESGRKDDRKNFKKLEELVSSKQVSIVVVTRLDRLSRSLLTLKKFVDLVVKNDCEIKALDSNIDTGSAAGKFHISLLGALAEMESDQISERVKHGLDFLIKNGKAFHAPFGYVNENYNFVYDTQPFLCTLSSKIEWSRYEIAVAIIDRYLQKKSLTNVSEWLNNYFSISRNKTQLSRWFRNPALLGHIHFPSTGDYFYNKHEPITDIEKLNEVFKILEFNKRVGGYGLRSLYNLSGLIRCNCGHTATIFQKKNFRYIYVECSLEKRCHLKSKIARYRDIEQKVFESISLKAEEIASSLSFEKLINPKIIQLQSELQQLESIHSPHRSIVAAIAELKKDIEQEKYLASRHDENLDAKLFIETFSHPLFWDFFETRDLSERQSILRRFIKRIIFNPFSIEFNI